MDHAVIIGYRLWPFAAVGPSTLGSRKANGYHQVVGRTLIFVGLALVVLGIVFTLGERLPIKLGRLPGDIVYRGKNSTFYFPIVTCLLLSAIVSLAMWLFGRR
jgi:hypothetical protein